MSGSRPSRTALKIARFIPLLDAVPRLRAVLPEGHAALVESILLESGAVSTRLVSMMRRPATLRFYEATEAVTGRGQLLWFGLRKRWLLDRTEEAIAAGARQLLVVGAGFDALAARTAERHPDVHCVEIDAPATAEPKRHALERLGRLRDNLEVSACDLAETSLGDALRSTRWRDDVRSMVVAEGLLMYLTRDDVERFLGAVREHTGAGSRVACSCVEAHDDGTPKLPVLDGTMRFLLRLAGEPMQWGIRPSDVPRFFGDLGYRVIEQPTLDDLRAGILAPIGLVDEPLRAYEHLVSAEHDGDRVVAG